VSAPLALVVVVATGGASDPVNAATLHAAELALGTAATVELAEVPTPADAELLEVSNQKHAAVALVRWDSPSTAVVHFHGWGSPRWVDRTVVFERDDAPGERGRALGFTLASMMPQAAPVSVTPGSEVAPAPVAPARRWLGAIDASASGAFVPEQYGTGLGAQLGFSLMWRRVGLRLGWSIRAGDVPPAQATAIYVSGALGVAATFIEPRPHQRFGFGGRLDLLLLYQSLTHLSADDVTPAHADRWLGGADAVLVGTFDLTAGAAFMLSSGVESAFGTTQVLIGQTPVAQVFPVRIVADVGVLARF